MVDALLWYGLGYLGVYWASYFLTDGDFLNKDKKPSPGNYIFFGVMAMCGPMTLVVAAVWGICHFLDKKP